MDDVGDPQTASRVGRRGGGGPPRPAPRPPGDGAPALGPAPSPLVSARRVGPSARSARGIVTVPRSVSTVRLASPGAFSETTTPLGATVGPAVPVLVALPVAVLDANFRTACVRARQPLRPSSWSVLW